MSSIKDQILNLVKQRHHSHKVALEQEKDPRSKHAIDLIARIREDSRLIEVIESMPEENLSYVTDSPGDPGHPGEPGISDLEEAAARYERENRQSVLSSVDIVNAFLDGARWMEGRK